MKKALTDELITMLETFRRYYAELMYWEAQYNFPTDKKMRERALAHKVGMHDEAMDELHRARNQFEYKYEGTELEGEACAVDIDKIIKQVIKEACATAEEMRRINGVLIK